MSSFRTLTRAMSTVPKHKVFSMQSLSPAMAKFGQIEWAKEIGAAVHEGEHFATLKTSKPISIGNESKGKVRQVKLAADTSGFLAALGLSEGALKAVVVESKSDVAWWSQKPAMNKRPTQIKW